MARTPQVKWSLSNENILTMKIIDGISIEAAAQSSGHTNWQNYYEDVAELLFLSQGMTQSKLEYENDFWHDVSFAKAWYSACRNGYCC